jgi:hypothetical protein
MERKRKKNKKNHHCGQLTTPRKSDDFRRKKVMMKEKANGVHTTATQKKEKESPLSRGSWLKLNFRSTAQARIVWYRVGIKNADTLTACLLSLPSRRRARWRT